MQITLTKKEAEDYFFDALCNGIGYFNGHGGSLTYEKKHYTSAKTKLVAANDVSVCYEDILMQILRDGKTLTFKDEEGEGSHTSTITLADVHAKVQNTPIQHISDMVNGTDDAETADAILQTVFFNEIIFG